jgi:hypothetical protein
MRDAIEVGTMNKNPADYMIGDDATIEDANVDELNLAYEGQKLTEARGRAWRGRGADPSLANYR